MEILELRDLTAQSAPGQYLLSDQAIQELLTLMQELDPTIAVTPEMLRAAAGSPDTHIFVAVEGNHIIGTASLCITHSPTGTQAGIEDVVVSSACRGRGLGRQLLEHILVFAEEKLLPENPAGIELHLTSRPSREAANQLYRSLSFKQHDTNVYKLQLRQRLSSGK